MKKRRSPGGIREQEKVYEETFDEVSGRGKHPVDKRAMELIEAGTYMQDEDGTPGTRKLEDGNNVPTDETFFTLVGESKEYLREQPFQKVLSEFFISVDKNAIDRLWRILDDPGRGKGRPSKLPSRGQLRFTYDHYVQLLQAFLDANKGQISKHMKENWTQAYPDLPEPDFRKHRTAGELAKDLVCKRLGISTRTLEKELPQKRQKDNPTADTPPSHQP